MAWSPSWRMKDRDFWIRQALCGKLKQIWLSNEIQRALTEIIVNFKSFTRKMVIVSKWMRTSVVFIIFSGDSLISNAWLSCFPLLQPMCPSRAALLVVGYLEWEQRTKITPNMAVNPLPLPKTRWIVEFVFWKNWTSLGKQTKKPKLE